MQVSVRSRVCGITTANLLLQSKGIWPCGLVNHLVCAYTGLCKKLSLCLWSATFFKSLFYFFKDLKIVIEEAILNSMLGSVVSSVGKTKTIQWQRSRK